MHQSLQLALNLKLVSILSNKHAYGIKQMVESSAMCGLLKIYHIENDVGQFTIEAEYKGDGLLNFYDLAVFVLRSEEQFLQNGFY